MAKTDWIEDDEKFCRQLDLAKKQVLKAINTYRKLGLSDLAIVGSICGVLELEGRDA